MALGQFKNDKLLIRVFSRVLATFLVIVFLFGLAITKPRHFLNIAPFNDVAVEAKMERKKAELRPEIKKIIEEIQKAKISQKVESQPINEKNTKSAVSNPTNENVHVSPIIVKPTEAGTYIGGSAISPHAAKENGAKNGKDINLPSFSKSTENTLFALDCRKIDKEDRPKDCPADSQAKELVKVAQAPKYRPENVVGFSAGEMKAKKFAGWRETCENESGGKYQFCIPFGKKPPRVKTPIELCKEKGLEGCKYPNLPDGSAPNPILTKE